MRLAAPAALVFLMACAQPPAPGWTRHRLAGRFACDLPSAWKQADEEAVPGQVSFMGDDAAIRVRFHDPKSSFADAEAYLRDPAGAKDALEDPAASVAGRQARVFHRRYALDLTGPEDAKPREEWIYESIVLVPASGGFWSLKFRRPSAPVAKPAGLDVFQGFLKTFQPLN